MPRGADPRVIWGPQGTILHPPLLLLLLLLLPQGTLLLLLLHRGISCWTLLQ